LKSEYSYDQYHWCPIVFTEIDGLLVSSNIYRIRNDGSAMKINIIAGVIVQINSIICLSSKFRLIILFKRIVPIMYDTEIIIIKIIIIAWSLNKINCSIRGDDLSCIDKFIHVLISNEIYYYL